MSQKKIATGETPRALGTLKGFLLCVGALVAFEMLEASERPRASAADMRAGLVGFGRREIVCSFGGSSGSIRR